MIHRNVKRFPPKSRRPIRRITFLPVHSYGIVIALLGLQFGECVSGAPSERMPVSFTFIHFESGSKWVLNGCWSNEWINEWMDGNDDWLDTMLSFQSGLNGGRAEVGGNEVGHY